MMTDHLLEALLRACTVLDDPDVTAERVASVKQLSAVLAQSLDDGFVIGDDVVEPATERRVAFNLAAAMMTFCESLDWPDGTNWWREYQARMRVKWLTARRAAEQLVSGAETPAEGLSDEDVQKDTPPPLASRSDLPVAVTRCGDVIAWTID
jgi:hypothetical protein